jgi:hypothetical protein
MFLVFYHWIKVVGSGSTTYEEIKKKYQYYVTDPRWPDVPSVIGSKISIVSYSLSILFERGVITKPTKY